MFYLKLILKMKTLSFYKIYENDTTTGNHLQQNKAPAPSCLEIQFPALKKEKSNFQFH